MPAPSSYARRQFPGAAVDTTLVAGINNSVTSLDLTSASGWPTGSYTGGILCELYSTSTGATAEKVWATALSSVTLTIVRAADGTSATSHSAGTGIRPVSGAVDADEANKAVNETVGQISGAGQILVGDGANSMAAVDAKTSGRILVGNGTTVASVAVSGDATLSAAGAVSIGGSKITNAMMADDAIDSAEIADGAIDLVHMSANSVDSDQYVDGSIDTAHLGDAQVTAAKLASSVAGSGLAGGAGTALSVGVDDSTIEINSDALRLKDDGVTLAKVAAAAKPRMLLQSWHNNTVALAGSSVSLVRLPEIGGAAAISRIVMPEAGAVIGVTAVLGNARTAGTLVLEVTKNGTGTGLTATLNGTDTQYAYATQAETADSFAAGDTIGVIMTATGFTPSANTIEVGVLVQAV